jgi:REP element-mobilizing transposase RayT
MSDLCDEYGINPNQIYAWQKILFENAEAAFHPVAKREAKRHSAQEEEVARLRAKLVQKNGERIKGSGVSFIDRMSGKWWCSGYATTIASFQRRLRLPRAESSRRMAADFREGTSFEAFEEVIGEAKTRLPMRLLGWAVLSKHWHFVLWPRRDGDLSEFMRWLQHVQTPQTEAELAALRRSVVRGSPFGEASWQERTAKRLGLQSTLRARGRPCKPQPTQE